MGGTTTRDLRERKYGELEPLSGRDPDCRPGSRISVCIESFNSMKYTVNRCSRRLNWLHEGSNRTFTFGLKREGQTAPRAQFKTGGQLDVGSGCEF
jgi:hypothetical protein